MKRIVEWLSDQQVGNWMEQVFDELKKARENLDKLLAEVERP